MHCQFFSLFFSKNTRTYPNVAGVTRAAATAYQNGAGQLALVDRIVEVAAAFPVSWKPLAE